MSLSREALLCSMQRASKRAIQTSRNERSVPLGTLVKLSAIAENAESILNHVLLMESDSYITPSFIPESVLRQKYLVDRLSIRDIAREFACSKTRVRDQLLRHNIPLRRRSQPPQDRWTTYGKRKVRGKIIDHKAELRAVATIKQMYAEGNNTSAIARILNTMKIPTKHQGKGWQQNTVAKILKRDGVYILGRAKGQGRVLLA